MSTVDESSKSIGQVSPDMETSKELIGQPSNRQISSVPGSLVSQSAPPESERDKTTSDGSGQRWRVAFASLESGPDGLCWRTSQRSLLGDSEMYSETWPRSAMIRSTRAYQLPSLERGISETGSGLWPTPTTRDWKDTPGMAREGKNPDGSKRNRTDLLPRRVYSIERHTVSSRRSDEQGEPSCGESTRAPSLDPGFVEWLMGYEIGHTDCED